MAAMASEAASSFGGDLFQNRSRAEEGCTLRSRWAGAGLGIEQVGPDGLYDLKPP